MQRTLAAVFMALVGAAAAQPLPNREEPRRVPVDQAIVLNPADDWTFTLIGGDKQQAYAVGLDQERGNPRMVVTEAGKDARTIHGRTRTRRARRARR